jgi:hypothetical protein
MKYVWVVKVMSINEYVRAMLDEDSIIFDNPSFDNSIIGITTDGQAVYDYDKMVNELMQDENISEIESVEWIDYNTLRAIPYAGEMKPVVIFTFKEDING